MYQVGERYNGLTLKRRPFFAVPEKVLSVSKKPDGRRVLPQISSKLTQALISHTHALGCHRKLEAYLVGSYPNFMRLQATTRSCHNTR